MADLSVTAGSVLPSNLGNLRQATLGEALAQGVVIFLDSNDPDTLGVGKAKGADGNDPTKWAAVGITVTSGDVNQPVLYASLDSDFTPGATLVVGQQYILSGTGGGKICPLTDLASGWRRIDLFSAKTTTKANLSVKDTGITA
jgi:hypothetical protein